MVRDEGDSNSLAIRITLWTSVSSKQTGSASGTRNAVPGWTTKQETGVTGKSCPKGGGGFLSRFTP